MTRRAEGLLLAAVVLEVCVFAGLAPRFSTVGNAFEIVRSSVELGLLAVALTPILVSGGIDVSVGAMMGLAAIVFGAAVKDWGVGIAGGDCLPSVRRISSV